VSGHWRRLHNEELHNPYTSPNSISVIRSGVNEMDRACRTHGRHEKFIQNSGLKTWREETTRKT